MNRLKKRVFCILLSAIMGTCSSGMGILASASDVDVGDIGLSEETNEKFNIDGDMLSVKQKGDDVVKITVKDENTGEEYYFISNPSNQTVYSSYTGGTVDVSDIEIEDVVTDTNNSGISLMSDSGYVGDVTSKISYHKLSSMIGDVASATITVSVLTGAV